MRSNISGFDTQKDNYEHYISEFLFKRLHDFNERIDTFFAIMKKMYPIIINSLLKLLLDYYLPLNDDQG